MFYRVIRIAVAAGALFLWGGCVRIDDLTPEEVPAGAISFDAGSVLPGDDATKVALPKQGFVNGDEFFVYGSKTLDGRREDVFVGTMVRLVSSLWGYDNIRFWDSQSTRYDFLAVSGPRSSVGISCNPEDSGPVTANVSYNAVTGECDLMAACNQRSNVAEGRWQDGSKNPVNLTDPVRLHFHHLLSAVSVTVANNSWKEVTLQSWRFQNLAIGGKATVVQNSSGIPDLSWMPTAYSTSTAVLGSAFPEPITLRFGTVYPNPASEDYADQSVVNMMIPQGLAGSGPLPQLVLSYTYKEDLPENPGSNVTISNTLPISLGEIKEKGTGNPITEWEPGVWYEYQVNILIGGDVQMNVIIKPWDAAEASDF